MTNRIPFSILFENQNIDFFFDSHPESSNPKHVTVLASKVLNLLDKELKKNKISDGDLLQALALVTSVRIFCSNFDSVKLRSFSDNLIESTIRNIKNGKSSRIGKA